FPSLLSQFLSHSPRPPPFASGHFYHVRAGHGRWRTVVNAGQHCWKACWGNPTGWSMPVEVVGDEPPRDSCIYRLLHTRVGPKLGAYTTIPGSHPRNGGPSTSQSAP